MYLKHLQCWFQDEKLGLLDTEVPVSTADGVKDPAHCLLDVL